MFAIGYAESHRGVIYGIVDFGVTADPSTGSAALRLFSVSELWAAAPPRPRRGEGGPGTLSNCSFGDVEGEDTV